jgi:hypothetical protein
MWQGGLHFLATSEVCMANEKENTAKLQSLIKNPSHERINVRLILDENLFYDEKLPVDVVRAIISPDVPDCFIQINTMPRNNPERSTAHYIHTSYIREILLLDELPEEKK